MRKAMNETRERGSLPAREPSCVGALPYDSAEAAGCGELVEYARPPVSRFVEARRESGAVGARGGELLLAGPGGRATVVHGNTQVLFDGMEVPAGGLLEVKSRSHAITAEVGVPKGGARGVIFGQGTWLGGYVLYAPEGRLKYVYNFLGLASYVVEAPEVLRPGTHQVRMEMEYDRGRPGRGGTVVLFVDGAEVARGRVENTCSTVLAVDATASVGDRWGSPVAPDMAVAGNRWSGEVEWVRIDLEPGAGEGDRRIPEGEMLRVLLGIH